MKQTQHVNHLRSLEKRVSLPEEYYLLPENQRDELLVGMFLWTIKALNMNEVRKFCSSVENRQVFTSCKYAIQRSFTFSAVWKLYACALIVGGQDLQEIEEKFGVDPSVRYLVSLCAPTIRAKKLKSKLLEATNGFILTPSQLHKECSSIMDTGKVVYQATNQVKNKMRVFYTGNNFEPTDFVHDLMELAYGVYYGCRPWKPPLYSLNVVRRSLVNYSVDLIRYWSSEDRQRVIVDDGGEWTNRVSAGDELESKGTNETPENLLIERKMVLAKEKVADMIPSLLKQEEHFLDWAESIYGWEHADLPSFFSSIPTEEGIQLINSYSKLYPLIESS